MDELIVDLHIHSHYSRATSKEMNVFSLYRWGKIKGLNVMGTGDFTHPLWLAELEQKLVDAEDGLWQLGKKYQLSEDKNLPEIISSKLLRFVLTTEVSCIYSRQGQLRKLHSLIVAPDFSVVKKINERLARFGNLHADGRPILSIDSEEVLKIVMDIDEKCMFIPAHIWTPWFGMFGSRSGFDSLEEAFGRNKGLLSAVETLTVIGSRNE